MKTLLFLTAEYANITADGKLNIMGIFHDIYAPEFPARHSSMHLVISLEAALGEYDQSRTFSIILMDDDAKTLMNISGPLQIPNADRGRKPEVNVILNLNDVIFPQPGHYTFVVMVDDEHKGQLSLHVNKSEIEVNPN